MRKERYTEAMRASFNRACGAMIPATPDSSEACRNGARMACAKSIKMARREDCGGIARKQYSHFCFIGMPSSAGFGHEFFPWNEERALRKMARRVRRFPSIFGLKCDSLGFNVEAPGYAG